METELLKTFLEVEKTRHFGRAADNLYLTQAAVSSRIRQLESALGISLFNRHRNNINLTLEGERLKPHAEAVIHAWNLALQTSSLNNEQSLHIDLGSTANIPELLLHECLQRIYGHYPGITLSCAILQRESLTQRLLKHALDVAIIFDRPKVDELSVEKIDSVPLALVSTRQSTSLSDINRHPYIGVEWGKSFNTLHAKQLPTFPAPLLHTSTERSALTFMLKNGGSAYLSEALAAPLIECGKLYLLEQAPVFHQDIYAAYLTNSVKETTLENIIKLFAQINNIHSTYS